MDFVERLIAIQKAEGMTDETFAATLGISRGLWLATRAEDANVRFELLAGAAQAWGKKYPILKEDTWAFLLSAKRRERQVVQQAVAVA